VIIRNLLLISRATDITLKASEKVRGEKVRGRLTAHKKLLTAHGSQQEVRNVRKVRIVRDVKLWMLIVDYEFWILDVGLWISNSKSNIYNS